MPVRPSTLDPKKSAFFQELPWSSDLFNREYSADVLDQDLQNFRTALLREEESPKKASTAAWQGFCQTAELGWDEVLPKTREHSMSWICKYRLLDIGEMRTGTRRNLFPSIDKDKYEQLLGRLNRSVSVSKIAKWHGLVNTTREKLYRALNLDPKERMGASTGSTLGSVGSGVEAHTGQSFSIDTSASSRLYPTNDDAFRLDCCLRSATATEALAFVTNFTSAAFHLGYLLKGHVDFPASRQALEDDLTDVRTGESPFGHGQKPRLSELRGPLWAAFFWSPLCLLSTRRLTKQPLSSPTLFEVWIATAAVRPNTVRMAEDMCLNTVWKLATGRHDPIQEILSLLDALHFDVLPSSSEEDKSFWCCSYPKKVPKPPQSLPPTNQPHPPSPSSRAATPLGPQPPPLTPSRARSVAAPTRGGLPPAGDAGNASSSRPGNRAGTVFPPRVTAGRRASSCPLIQDETPAESTGSGSNLAPRGVHGHIRSSMPVEPCGPMITYMNTARSQMLPFNGSSSLAPPSALLPGPTAPYLVHGVNKILTLSLFFQREAHRLWFEDMNEASMNAPSEIASAGGDDDSVSVYFAVVDCQEYDCWSDSQALAVFCTRHILTYTAELPLIPVNEQAATHLGPLSRDCLIQDLASSDECMAEKTIEFAGTLADFFAHGTAGRMLQISNQPILCGLSPRIACDSTSVAWQLAPGWDAYIGSVLHSPLVIQRARCASAGTYEPTHFSPVGVGIRMEVNAGVEIIYVGVAQDKSRPADFAAVNLVTGVFDPDTSNRELWRIVPIVLYPGMTLTLQPNTPFARFSPWESISTTCYFYSSSTLISSMFGVFHSFAAQRVYSKDMSGANFVPLLARIVSFWHRFFVRDAMTTDSERAHLPDLTQFFGLKTVMAAGIMSELAAAVNPWGYLGTLCTERVQMVRIRQLLRELLQWVLSRCIVRASSTLERVDIMKVVFYPWLALASAGLVSETTTAEKKGYRNDAFCTATQLSDVVKRILAFTPADEAYMNHRLQDTVASYDWENGEYAVEFTETYVNATLQTDGRTWDDICCGMWLL